MVVRIDAVAADHLVRAHQPLRQEPLDYENQVRLRLIFSSLEQRPMFISIR